MSVPIPFASWRRPTDDAYAFQLCDRFVPAVPPLGTVTHVDDVAGVALVAGDGERLYDRVSAWAGPEDVDAHGHQPWQAPQRTFVERRWRRLDHEALEEVLCGTARVMRGPHGQVDYVLRDHHMLDVALYHYRTTGELPEALFHADRHSDWCRDGYLLRHRPAQAATWWTLLEGLKRPGGAPLLGEGDVHFTTARPGPEVASPGRDVGAATRVPWWVDRQALDGPTVAAGASRCDWVSLDLDHFLPLSQLALTRGLLRDASFHTLMRSAKVRVFVLSPQFTDGGEVLSTWTLGRRRHGLLRMLRLVRGMRVRTA